MQSQRQVMQPLKATLRGVSKIMKVMLHLTRMSSGAKMGETIVTHCAHYFFAKPSATSWGIKWLRLSVKKWLSLMFYTECHISSFHLRAGFNTIRKRNIFYNIFKLPNHTYSDNQSPIIPQDVAARLVIQQRAQCVTIFSPFFAPLDMRVTCNITFIILDVRICHLEDKGIFSLHAQSKWNSLLY